MLKKCCTVKKWGLMANGNWVIGNKQHIPYY